MASKRRRYKFAGAVLTRLQTQHVMEEVNATLRVSPCLLCSGLAYNQQQQVLQRSRRLVPLAISISNLYLSRRRYRRSLIAQIPCIRQVRPACFFQLASIISVFDVPLDLNRCPLTILAFSANVQSYLQGKSLSQSYRELIRPSLITSQPLQNSRGHS